MFINSQGETLSPPDNPHWYFGSGCTKTVRLDSLAIMGISAGKHLPFPAAASVDGNALAILTVGEQERPLDVVYGGAGWEIDRFGYGVVRVTLKSRLHADVPFRGDVVSGHEESAEFGRHGADALD